MSWLILSEIPYATWKSISKVLRVDQNIKVKRITFAVKAAKTNSIKIRSSTPGKGKKARENQREHKVRLNSLR